MSNLNIIELIHKKRDGLELAPEEITAIVEWYITDKIPDYQMAAWLMAVCIKGMTEQETVALTMAMARSGRIVDLSTIPGIKVDKHSTGGVADSTTLILAPLVAAAGVPMAKMSGRGLGFTGGTIDKLESIPGFRANLQQQEFVNNIKKYNLAITSQNENIAPADGKIYALRDVTGTVESIPLIASSIMSKKIAAGADKIILDVKVGSGAFMKSIADAVRLARTMVNIGEQVNRETCAVITSMEQPLGQAIGNSLEIKEAIDVLNGKDSYELKELCLELGSRILLLGGIVSDIAAGKAKLTQLLADGSALRKFGEFIEAQDGDARVLTQENVLPKAKYELPIFSIRDGYVKAINAAQIGYAAIQLGAGRKYKGQQIDLTAGIILKCRLGDYVKVGQILAVVHTNIENLFSEVQALLFKAYEFSPFEVEKPAIVLGIVDKNGFTARKTD